MSIIVVRTLTSLLYTVKARLYLQTLSELQWPRGEDTGLRLLACWNCGFEFPWKRGGLSVVSVVCCQVDVCLLWVLCVVRWMSVVSVVCCQVEVSLLWVLCVVRWMSVCCKCCVLSGGCLSVVSVVYCQVDVWCECCVLSGGCLSVVSVVCCQVEVCLLWVLCDVRWMSVCCECCVLSGGALSVVSVVWCQVEFCATGRSIFQRNPSDCVCVCVIRRTNSSLHLKCVGRERSEKERTLSAIG
jgi:hypothetical protein